jgi:hypothetical protein
MSASRAENMQKPAFVAFFHQLKQSQRSFAVKKKIFIQHEK